MASNKRDNDNSGERKKIKKQKQSSFEEFRDEYLKNTPCRNNVVAKHDSAAPYYFFLTRVTDSINSYSEDLTISFPELLDSSLGELECSLHINFMVELPWLLAQYMVTGHKNPEITLLYGVDDDDLTQPPKHLRLTCVKVKSPYPFGHHHTKMSIFYYKDKSIRVAVYTANLIESDWDNRTQGLWLSQRCPYLGDDAEINDGESPTLFKYDLIKYLNSYKKNELHPWIRRLQKTDFSHIRVFFVASVPGDDISGQFGHKKVNRILKEYVTSTESCSWKLIVQCSSIGTLGPTSESWLTTDLAESLNCRNVNSVPQRVSVVYPSFSNVESSYDGMLGGACLPYSSRTHKKQLWLNNYLHQWKSEGRFRSRAVPHIKTYTRASPDGKRISWFLVTSANLSKAAWGMSLKNGITRPLSYEAGILFLPQILIEKESFEVRKKGNFTKDESFPLPYDLPLTAYSDSDKIFLYDKCFKD